MAKLREPAGVASPTSNDTALLIHDLHVHQIELELQNEELRQTQAELLRSKRKYIELYDEAPVGYCTISLEGTILEVNLTLSQLLGMAPSSLVGQRLSHSVVGEGSDQVYFLLKSLRESGKGPSTTLRMNSGEQTFWARIDASSVVEDENWGEVVHLAVSNVTEERRAEAVRVAAKISSLETLAGGIAHDFNNLLGGLFGYLSLARESLSGDNPAMKYLDKATAVFQRARNLTQQLMAFTKGNLPAKRLQPLGPLLDRAELVLSGTQTRHVISTPADLWQAPIDENQLGQVFDNLLKNASEAMTSGGTVSIQALNLVLEEGNPYLLKKGRYIELSISDSGTGISPTDVDRIFDPFFTTKKSGHGLGLAMCHAIIKKHEGTILVSSVPGKGATFTVLLPASTEEAEGVLKVQSKGHRGTGTIVIMDDEDFYREILVALVRGMGYEVIETENGDAALAACRSAFHLTAVVLDLTVPGGKGGTEIVQPLRDLAPGLVIIACSGFAQGPVLSRPTDFGFTASLQKPFLPQDLEILFDRHLGSH